MNTTTYLLFGKCGQNVAQNDARFTNHLTRAFGGEAIANSKEEAERKIANWCGDEDGEIISPLSYSADSRTWYYRAVSELTEAERTIALRDCPYEMQALA